MNVMNCDFSGPVNYLGEPPAENEVWNFQYASCSDPQILTISDDTYTAFISKEINIADIFIIGFLTILLGALIFKFLWDFFHPKVVKYHSRLDL